MIRNIWAYIDELQAYIAGITAVSDVFSTRIYAGKPIIVPTGKYLYFQLLNNSEKVGNDRVGGTKKMALLEFYIIGNDKNMPDVEIYEALDALSNAIVTIGSDDDIIDMGDMIVHSIAEGAQSGILQETDENPYLIAQYNILYKYRY